MRALLPRVFSVLCLLLLALPTALRAERTSLVEVYGIERDDGSYEFYANNYHIIPVYVQVDAPNLVNMKPDRELPVGVGLEAGARSVLVFTLSPTRDSGRRGYSLQYTYAQGNPDTARHDDDHLYLLPFAHGDKYRLSQGFHGSFSHLGENEFAVDFEMDEGTEVFAARGGTVAEVREDSRTGGPSASYGDDANYVLVLHDDGSFGNYAHLMPGGAAVEPGDIVRAGQLIGYSGNTGRSSGPHLHFDVRLPTYAGTMTSVPFLFKGRDDQGLEPIEGRFYYAYHPGGAPFEETFGRELTMAAYSDYRAPVTDPEGIQTRVEQVDLTFLLFVRNGFAESTDVEISLQLMGMVSDAGNTVRVTAPAHSEILATILRPAPGASTIRYGYTIRYSR